jgi:hypothetical protein
MGILEDAKTAEDKTVIYAEDLTYLDEMNGINDDIYIIYIYNGKNLRIQKGYTVS